MIVNPKKNVALFLYTEKLSYFNKIFKKSLTQSRKDRQEKHGVITLSDNKICLQSRAALRIIWFVKVFQITLSKQISESFCNSKHQN